MSNVEQVAEAPRASRVKEKPFSRGEPFGARIMPAWGKKAARWFLQFHDPMAWAWGVVVGLFAAAAGAVLMFGNGLFSIKGAWALLALVGVPVAHTAIPAPIWWLLPAVLALSQAMVRHVEPMRWFWYPSVAFDGVTTALAIAGGLVAVVGLEQASGMGAVVGLAIAVLADRALLGAVAMLWELWKHRKG